MFSIDKIYSSNEALFPDDDGIYDEQKLRLEKHLDKFNAVMTSLYL
jgi:hypothetical protein